jgi:prepilin-type N-terminal cleavage/methylation domain-containing protein
MKSAKGFTLVEVMVVTVLIGVMLLLTLTYGMSWYRMYRFQEVAQTFANAALAVRVRAIGGMLSLYVQRIERQGSGSTFRVYLPTFTYVCPRDSANSSRPWEFPVKGVSETPYQARGDAGEDYVILSGFNSPSNVNENLFRVMVANYGSVTQVSGTTDQWQVSNAYLDLECRYCDPSSSGVDCTSVFKTLYWDVATMGATPQPSATGWAAGREMGKLRVVPCLKFVPYNSKQNLHPELRTTAEFGLNKEFAGNSVQCVYNAALFDIKVKALQRRLTPTSPESVQFTPAGGYVYTCPTPPPSTITVPPSVVFDYGGNTRDHLKYFVEIRRLKSDGYSTMSDESWPPVGFVVDPSGRVRMGRFSTHTEQFP